MQLNIFHFNTFSGSDYKTRQVNNALERLWNIEELPSFQCPKQCNAKPRTPVNTADLQTEN